MIRPTTSADVIDLAPRLREADLREIKALTGLGPLEALSMGLFQSDDCQTAIGRDGSIVGIFGTAPYNNVTASVWLLTSPEIVDNKREVLITGRRWLDERSALYPVLTNVVDASNDVHLMLIKHLGFTMLDPIDNFGPGKIRVIQFERRR